MKIENLSIRARVAYSILCLESFLKVECKNLEMFDWLLNELWKYTFSNLGSWHENIAEVTPFSIEEDIDYLKKGCTFINHEKHEDLKLLYSKTNNSIKIVINKIFESMSKS